MAPFLDAIARLDDEAFRHYALFEKTIEHPPLPPAAPEHVANAEATLAGRFSIIGEAHVLPPGFSWTHNPSRDKEWQIAHHKFYFGVDLIQAYAMTCKPAYLERWIVLTASWLDEMGTGFITSSDAQVEAKRVESWITAYLLLRRADVPKPVPGDLLRRWLGRIAGEAQYITQHLKPSRNHRTFQLYAVFLTGVVFPEFRESRAFVEEACCKLGENLLNDFPPDGVHIERSTHYHNITLETGLSFLEWARLNNIAVPHELPGRLHRALEFAAHAQFPDGEIPLINDSDTLDHRSMFEAGFRLFDDPVMQWAATRGRGGSPPQTPSREFGGYLVLSDAGGRDPVSFANRQHVFFDCAPLGDGSHSHYDLFNVTWFANGQQIVVDPGRYTYDPEPDSAGIDWRGAFKSTAFHNTVEIDGTDQTRYRSKSRTPPPGVERYDKTVHKANHGPDVEIRNADHCFGRLGDWAIATAASHEYTPLHTRAIVFARRQYLVVLDHVEVSDGEQHTAVLRFHLAAPWLNRVRLISDGRSAVANADSWEIHTVMPEGGRAELGQGWVSKSYGLKTAAPVLTAMQRSRKAMTFCSILFPVRVTTRLVKIETVQGSAVPDVPVFRAEIEREGARHIDTFAFARVARRVEPGPNMQYEGRLLAYSATKAGELTYLQAAGPGRLGFGPDASLRDHADHVEWIDPGRT
jgi:hypothetical protein